METHEYKFQIDTTDSFNSFALEQSIVYSQGGLVSWNVPFNLVENRVYYWRIALNQSNVDSIIWKESSFIYKPGEEGWSQAHYYQFKEDDYNFINYNRASQKFSYVDVPRQLRCHNTSQYLCQAGRRNWHVDILCHQYFGTASLLDDIGINLNLRLE